MITVKNNQDIEKMRVAGRLTRMVLQELEKHISPGITTKRLDEIAYNFIKKNNASPSFLNYRGFPASICVSINDEVVHGIPGERKLRDGDIVSIDCGVYIGGFHGDCARTYPVGAISDEASELMSVTRQSFYEGIKYARAGNRIGDISFAIMKYVEDNHCSVVKDLVGHGIGRNIHEDPSVPNYGIKGRGPRLTKGMTIAIEPMINYGDYKVMTLPNRWTVKTADGSLSSHYENTVLITDKDPEILTRA